MCFLISVLPSWCMMSDESGSDTEISKPVKTRSVWTNELVAFAILDHYSTMKTTEFFSYRLINKTWYSAFCLLCKNMSPKDIATCVLYAGLVSRRFPPRLSISTKLLVEHSKLCAKYNRMDLVKTDHMLHAITYRHDITPYLAVTNKETFMNYLTHAVKTDNNPAFRKLLYNRSLCYTEKLVARELVIETLNLEPLYVCVLSHWRFKMMKLLAHNDATHKIMYLALKPRLIHMNFANINACDIRHIRRATKLLLTVIGSNLVLPLAGVATTEFEKAKPALYALRQYMPKLGICVTQENMDVIANSIRILQAADVITSEVCQALCLKIRTVTERTYLTVIPKYERVG